MDPLLIVIISFGLIFVVTASLGNGLSVTIQSISAPLKAHKQLNVMLLLSNFIVLPVLLIGLAAILPFEPQVKMAIAALALSAGAPFIPWLVSLAKGDLAYSVSAVILLTLGTFIVLPLALPVVLNLLGTGATPSIVARPLAHAPLHGAATRGGHVHPGALPEIGDGDRPVPWTDFDHVPGGAYRAVSWLHLE